MPRISIARLFEDNETRLKLAWQAGQEGASKTLAVDTVKKAQAASTRSSTACCSSAS